MHHITTSKESGVISGVQKHEGDDRITWSKHLPSTCQLSLGMKEMIRELLAGMLEPDATK